MTEQTNTAPERDRPAALDGDSDELQSGVAATYAVLAECWREPTEQLVKVANAGELAPVVGDVGSVDRQSLRAEHTRLFIGPAGPPCPPYESVYRDGDADDELGPVRGPATMAVTRWYQEFGIQPAPDHPDLPDHIATELEFAAYLADEGRVDRLGQFLDEHLRQWTDEFLTQVEQESREPFYTALAESTREVVYQ